MDRKTKFRRMRRQKRNNQIFIGLLTLLVFCFVILLVQWNDYQALPLKDNIKKQSLPTLAENTKKNTHIPKKAKEQEVENKNSAPKPEARKIDPEIKIVFAGDTMFDWDLRPILEVNGYDYPFVYIKDKVQKADYAFVNAETVFTNKTDKDPSQLFWIKSDPRGLQALKNTGFDILNLGNNHTLDYLRPGLNDTLQFVEQFGFDYIGAGRNEEEAYASKEIVIKGKKFRFFSFVRFLPDVNWIANKDRSGIPTGYDLELVKKTILEQKGDADYTVVYFHWGKEKHNIPDDYQYEYVKELQKIGVDLIVGSHPHWLQGFQYYNGMPVAYSLGNFLFPPYVKNESAQTGLLNVTFKGDQISMNFDPYILSKGQIIPVEDAHRDQFFRYLQSISFDVEITSTGDIISK
ncbi:CapA family protein [Lederbergia wuyishanensis]|uniref:Poly-gamma-glutamate synthesis protein (Capsule biosynthesis protein) n=1 Tax=Lederbergia wuyishanensis TaxID=1347903 RepID=A0ABU0D0L3_9BACI|nr:CapA family protein [Lederbergia wuyishanensis]MCJ8006555.1 CapA family protein [Lederbergia wuyishanensis]MDQ0341934.1 poly-gamma-glutamate synthesis protein (capsule biosynthesis protein) [Lederbergia wuyishanensis]